MLRSAISVTWLYAVHPEFLDNNNNNTNRYTRVG